ncbi:MAG: filamentous hemagglutinin N-terminal domain-containing protein [Cyanobacteria bacterium SID2]|nr:filamentous hemagglutinin N-terminal domain-containing protein [Cyanobacteria bacterium SID2]MBP0003911.1 filamentous hemagglutinin N-terminal domain-containing protein [Cyanobacteria bacterium SBC]
MTTQTFKRPLDRVFGVARSSILILTVGQLAPVFGQVIPDETLPIDTQVTLEENRFVIEGGTAAGSNLFHSFERFSVPTNSEVFFNNATTIENILTRVTGNQISNIDGLIRANGAANLFLLNPNGIVFGPNAQLNIGGSFLSSTADRFVFEDGSFYSATDVESQSLLAVTVPLGVQYNANPGSIEVRGLNQNVDSDFINLAPSDGEDPPGLQVSHRQTLALLGGDISIDGSNLIAPAGRIELGSVAANNTVVLVPQSQGWTFDYGAANSFRDIQIIRGSLVDTAGERGGDMQLQGRQIVVSQGSTVTARTQGSGIGGTVVVRASDLVEVIGGQTATRVSVSLASGATGRGGNFLLETNVLRMVDGGQIGAGTLGVGDAGNATIRAQDIEIIGTDAFDRFPSGIFVTVQALGTGQGGNLTVEAERLSLLNGGRLNAFSLGNGDAGDITIRVDDLEIRGKTSIEQSSSGIIAFSTVNFAAGSIDVSAETVQVREGGEITVSNFANGDAGNLNVNADLVRLEEGGILSSQVRAGSRGNIALTAGSVQLQDESQITTNATGTATGGNIRIDAETLALTENSTIDANAVQGAGGNIQIVTEGIFQSSDSTITASSQFGVAGIVEVTTPEIDTASGLVELSQTVVDPADRVVSACRVASEGNSFTITGRGGLPPDPTRPLQHQRVWVDLRDFNEIADESQGEIESQVRDRPVDRVRVVPAFPIEAQGWSIDAEGNVELISRRSIEAFRALDLCD